MRGACECAAADATTRPTRLCTQAIGQRLLLEEEREQRAPRLAALSARAAEAGATAQRLQAELDALLRIEEGQALHIEALSTTSATVGV